MLDSIYQNISLQGLAWLVVLLPFLGSVINGFISVVGGHRSVVSLTGVLSMLLALTGAVLIFITLVSFERTDPSFITGPIYSWIAAPSLSVEIGLKVDQLSVIMMLLILVVGSLVHLYSVGYMGEDGGYARYFSLLNLLISFMLLLVLADNLILMFVGWEGVGIVSSLLISFWFDDDVRANAGNKAFIVDRIGDVFFLAGIFLIYAVMESASAPMEAGYFNFQMMERYNAYFVPTATIISLLLFMGAVAKSAQIPLSIWLPDSTFAPTPVTALIHSVTVVAAGVYMVVRLNFIFALSPVALDIIATLGAVTALYAATVGLAQTSIKKILAYSTISQLGYMFLAVGLGAFSAAIFHLVTHSFFKALLFLSAGGVIHEMNGEHDIRKFGGLKYKMPITSWTFVVGAAAISGIIPFAGFFSKDAILWQAFERREYLLWFMGFLTAGITAFYIFRAVGLVFFGETNIGAEKFGSVRETSTSMLVPMLFLAFLSVAGGLMGVPEVLGGINRIWQWLSPIIAYEMGHSPEGSELGTGMVLTVVTLLWSLHFCVVGWVIYAQRREWSLQMIKKFGFIYKLLADGYYLDEIYNFLLVRPVKFLSERIFLKGIDEISLGSVITDGTAKSIGYCSSLLSLIQNGKIGYYLLYFLIGAVVIIGFLVL